MELIGDLSSIYGALGIIGIKENRQENQLSLSIEGYFRFKL